MDNKYEKLNFYKFRKFFKKEIWIFLNKYVVHDYTDRNSEKSIGALTCFYALRYFVHLKNKKRSCQKIQTKGRAYLRGASLDITLRKELFNSKKQTVVYYRIFTKKVEELKYLAICRETYLI